MAGLNIDKFEQVLKDWGVEYDRHMGEIDISPRDNQSDTEKVVGDPWASTTFVFNDDGSFKHIDIAGD